MDNKNLLNKLKSGISTQQLEDFAHKHTPEVFAICAIVIASISSLFDFFTGSGWAVLFFAIGTILGVAFPAAIESKLSKLFRLISHQDKTTEMIIGGMQIILALFLPFIYFGFLGLFAGTSYHSHFNDLADR